MEEEDPFFEGSEELSFFQALLRLSIIPLILYVGWRLGLKLIEFIF